MLNLYKKKLLVKFGLILFTVFLLAGGFSIYYLSSRNTANLIKNLDESTSNLLMFAKTNYGLPLYNFDTDNIKNLNHSLVKNKNISAINVFSYNEFISGLSAADTTDFTEKPYLPTNESFEKKLRADVVYKNDVIGHIEIFYSAATVYQEIREQTLQLIILFSIIFLSMLVFLFISLKRGIVNHIIALAELSKRVATEHRYDISISAKGEDEISVLYRGFDDMLKKVAERDFELKKIKSYLSNIIESMPSMLITVDENNIVTQWNQSAVKFTGIQATEILGKNILEAMPSFGEYMDKCNTVLGNKQPMHFYRTHLNTDPHNFKNISLYPLVANGVKGVVVRIDDITELEEKDDQLRQIQKMEMIGTLVGGLAHDFNNVLGGIVGTLSILKFKYKKNRNIDPDDLFKHLMIIDESGQRAVDMVSQLLSISRKQELSLVPVDLNLSVKHVMKICQNTFDKSIELKPNLPDKISMSMADPTQMEQVILNLCVNASHAMTIMRKADEKQGGILSIAIDEIIADKHFCFTHPESEEIEYLRLTVSDTGIGMEQRTIAKIFEPFFTTKEKGKGTGLGLAMVYNIIRQHRGFIDVYSEVGIGTTFNVFLPKLINTDLVVENSEEPISYNGSGTILVVDDDINMRRLAEIMLQECGYSVICAENGIEGVAKYIEYKKEIKLVLLDMIMPKMSGKEAFIQMVKINPAIKVLLSSGFRQDERVEEVVNLGCSGFIQKPYSLINLSKKVSEILGQTE